MKQSKSEKDFWGDNISAIPEIVYDSLKNNDVDILRGLQGFGISLWSWTIAGCEVLSFLIRRTVEEKVKRKEERKKWEKELYPIEKEKREELYSNKVGISFNEFQHATKNIHTATLFIKGLQEMGFAEVVDKNPEGYENDPRGVFVLLTPVWDKTLETLETDKKEAVIFSESIGKLLTFGVLKEMEYLCIGLASYKPLARLVSQVKDDDTPISREVVEKIYEECGQPKGKFYQMLAYDAQRDPSIRFIKKDTGKESYLNYNVIRAYALIHQRALEISRRRRFGLGP
jgi:hypothetical protein